MCWSISHEIGTQQQRDQCQNFSLGHNFCHRTVDCSQISIKWVIKIVRQYCMSPRIGPYRLKLVLNCNNTSVKISILVKILQIKLLIEAKQVKSGPSKFFINLAVSPQMGWLFKRLTLNVHSVCANFCLNVHSLCTNFCLNVHSLIHYAVLVDKRRGMYIFLFYA